MSLDELSPLESEPAPAPAVPQTLPALQSSRVRPRWWIGLGLGLLVLAGATAAAVPYWQASKRAAFKENCELARQAQDWQAELTASTAWTTWDPLDGDAWFYAAEAAQKLDDLEKLSLFLSQVPESHPNALLGYVEKANLEWTTLNRPLDAVQTSDRILKLDPRVLEVHARLISYYAMTLQRGQMLDAIRRAIDAGAEPREAYSYYLMADSLAFTNGAELNSRWLVTSPDELQFKIGLAVHTAMRVAQSADVARSPETAELDKEAMQQLHWFIERQPDDPILISYLLQRAWQDGDASKVEGLLKRVTEKSAADHMIWVVRAWYHLSHNDPAKAEEAVLRALKLHPISPSARHEYASILRHLKRPEAEVQQRLAAAGRELRTQLLRAPSVTEAPDELLIQMVQYLTECGDTAVAEALSIRMNLPLTTP